MRRIGLLPFVLFGIAFSLTNSIAQIDPSSLVNPFTGSLQYSTPLVTVPGPAGSGITINLQYSSDVRPEQEASWVGFGWSLDLPMITRAKRGLPDDYYDAKVVAKHNVPDHTISMIRPLGMTELFKIDNPLSLNLTIIDDSERGMDVLVNGGLSQALSEISSELNGLTGSWAFREGSSPSFGISASRSSMYNSGSSWFKIPDNIGLRFNQRRTPTFMSPQMSSVSMSTVNVQGTFKTGVNESDAPEIGLNVTSVSVQIGDIERRAFGFMYSPEANTEQSASALLDYSVERPTSVETSDRPFAPFAVGDVDLFHVNGLGVSGTFRAFHRLPFEVRPARTEVISEVKNLHAEIMVLGPVVTPTSVTKGYGFGSVVPIQSETSYSSGAEPQEGVGSRYAMQEDADVALDRNFIFRYISDPADELKVSHHDSPVYGELKSGLATRDYHELNRDRPVRSNSFVRPLFREDVSFWNYLPEYVLSASLGIPFNDRMLMGFETVSSAGLRYVFDQPIGVANEEVSTRVLRDHESLDRTAPRVYHVPSEQATQDPVSSYREYHEVRNLSLYADAFFVTSITTPDYADKGAPGPDNEDDGGWTKFTYQLVTSRQDVRSPYNGYWFDKGLLENPWDDKLVAMRASRTSRVIKTIETPTHIAKFFTNKDDALADRKDAWGAQIEQVAQTSSTDKNGENRSVYLTRVELHKKLENGQTQLISTTHLAYDYSLVPGNPSSSDGVGKLSLRKVWTEMGKVKDAYISPTEFYYEYPTLLSSGLTTASTVNIGRLTSLYSGLSTIAPSISPSAQNPQFDPNNVDAWGLPGAVGVQSGIPKFRTSSSLLPLPYDPTPAPINPILFAAPYTLKRIHSPSGAEVLVKYEPSDYSSVQDSSAMAYMPLLGNLPTQSNSTDWNQNQFAVSIAAITGTPRRTEYLNELRRRFVSGGELLQGKFVYQLGLRRSGRTNEDNALTSAKTYVKVFDVSFGSSGADNSTVVFTIGSPIPVVGGNVDIRTLAERTRNLPFYQALVNYRESSRAYYKAAKSGNVLSDAIAMCDLLIDRDGPEGVDEKDDLSVERFPTLIPQASKLRLPCIGPKQSNAPRVRMIAAVSPDGMLQTNDASVVGREFTYTEVGKFGLQSSGVATQEPVALRDVMGLVQAKPELLRELAGNPSLTALDIERVETPLGESFLPGASIGYARIVERSLFDGEANTGTVVRRFLTAREVPTVRSEWVPRIARKKESSDILRSMIDYSTEEQEVQQGYAFHIREGHGLPLSIERYSGRASGVSTSTGIPDGLTLLSSTKWYYDTPESEELLFDTLTRPLRFAHYGSEMEITGESKRLEMNISNVQVQYGLSLTITQFIPPPPIAPLPIPFASACPSWQYVNNTLTSYVSTKVIRHPLRLRSIVSMQDGARDSAEIVAYDSKTGYPALNQSFDGYNGLALDGATSTHLGNKLSIQVPALRAYAEMGHRSEAEGLTFVVPHHGSPSLDDGGLWTGGVNLSLSGSQLTIAPIRSRPADVVKSISAYQKLFTIGDVVSLSSYDGTSAGTAKVTAVTYTTSPQPGLQLGLTGLTATPSSLDRVKILRSARTNQLVQQIAQYQAYGIDLTPAKDYAKMLRDRERTAEILTDLTRAGSSYIGMKWWRPLVRHYMYPRDIIADEDAVMLSKLYPPIPLTNHPCRDSETFLEAV